MDTSVEFPKHDKYKNTGLPWVDEIPTTWELKKNKFLLKEKKATVGKSSSDYQLLSLTLRGVIARDMDNPQGKFPAEFDTYKKVIEGDLVFCLFDVEETPRAVGLAKEDGMITGAYTILECTQEVSARYVNYYYLALDSGKRLKSLYTGLRNVIKIDTFMSVKTPFPPREEQDRIANFLDQKTAEIDEAIAKKQRLIELLKEQKAILINQAVTKGLNPDVPLRDSGVEWIGEVPAHWRLTKLKHSIDLLPGFAFKSEQYSSDDSDIPLLRGININPGLLKWDDVVYWPKEKLKHLRKYLLAPGDYVIGMDRPWISSGIRVVELVDNDLPCLLFQRVARIRATKDLSSFYLGLLLRSDAFLAYFEPMLSGISVPHISPDQIGNFLTVFPPKREQEAICTFASSVEEKHNDLIGNEEALISKLMEYKNGMISDAVTGKIKI